MWVSVNKLVKKKIVVQFFKSYVISPLDMLRYHKLGTMGYASFLPLYICLKTNCPFILSIGQQLRQNLDARMTGI